MLKVTTPSILVPHSLSNMFFPKIAGLTRLSIRQLAFPSGDTEIVPTIPAGHKFVAPTISVTNPTTSSITANLYLRRSSTNYSIKATTGTITARSGLILSFISILEPNDSLLFNFTLSGPAAAVTGYLVPTAYPLKPVFAILANGDNTLYTCPAGKIANLVYFGYEQYLNGGFAAHYYSNLSGGTRIVTSYIVPPAGSPSTANAIGQRSVGTNTGSSVLFPSGMYMTAGETYVVNTNSGAGTQTYAALFWEEDAP